MRVRYRLERLGVADIVVAVQPTAEVNDMVLGFEVVPPKETSRLPSGASRILSDQQSTRTSWLSCLRSLAIRSEAIAERSLRRRIRRLAWAGSFLHARRPRGCDVQRGLAASASRFGVPFLRRLWVRRFHQ